MRKLFTACFCLLTLAGIAGPTEACTNFIASKEATVDGSVIVTYTCDGEFHPVLRRWPAEDHEPGAVEVLHDWYGEYMGEVALPERTYAVVNLQNEHQVVIAETTTTGREELINPDGMLNYWDLMRLVLQRAASAREAISVFADLVNEYGYNSSGESFYIGDPEEAWIMEMVGPGPDPAEGSPGAYWVALRVPAGMVCAHANLGRIDSFPRNDPENCLYSPGMEDFAAANGWYDVEADGEFSWRKTFHPATPQNLRYTATRVWSLYRRAAPSQEWPSDFHRGVAGAEPLPLFVKPDEKLDVPRVFDLMRDHYEGTDFDMTQGVDAGPYATPYRWRPMGFEVDGASYTWERPISTQQTGFSMVTQSRAWLPDAIGGLAWYGVDDTWFTCYVPLYCGIEEVPASFAKGSLQRFSWDSAWWVFNFVSNYANLKYSYMIEDIQAVQGKLEGDFLALQPSIERTAVELASTDPELMTRYLTGYSVEKGEEVVRRWRELGEFLLTKYNDGYVKNEKGRPQESGYPEEWLRAVLEARPEQFRLPIENQGELSEPTEF
jgi:dipeptidase